MVRSTAAGLWLVLAAPLSGGRHATGGAGGATKGTGADARSRARLAKTPYRSGNAP